ncbi:MAG TPA: hypothetical protein VMC85_17065, partial [Desulfomonilaceae bacterium]|nr:hypothetical protein [Desulfomonilaceae bacterium]
MKSLLHRSLLLVAAMLVLHGCGETPVEKKPLEATEAQKTVAELQSELARSERQLLKARQETNELQRKLQTLESAPSKEAARPMEKITPDEKRIELLGAKAIAEYQVDQLSRRLDELTKNLNLKEKELEAIRQTAGQRESEVEALRKTVEELQAKDQKRTTELTSRLDKMTQELQQRSADAQRFKHDLDDKSELLNSLKNAVGDASKLKSQAEAEANKLRAELQEATTRLDVAERTVEQNRGVIERMQAQDTESRQHIAWYHQAAEQCKEALNRLQQESQGLR